MSWCEFQRRKHKVVVVVVPVPLVLAQVLVPGLVQALGGKLLRSP